MEERVQSNPQAKRNHSIVLNMRNICNITGVLDVISFDEDEVILETVEGVITIKGKELHVSRLTLEKGELDIDGVFHSFSYKDGDSYHKPNESLLKRLLR